MCVCVNFTYVCAVNVHGGNINHGRVRTPPREMFCRGGGETNSQRGATPFRAARWETDIRAIKLFSLPSSRSVQFVFCFRLPRSVREGRRRTYFHSQLRRPPQSVPVAVAVRRPSNDDRYRRIVVARKSVSFNRVRRPEVPGIVYAAIFR